MQTTTETTRAPAIRDRWDSRHRRAWFQSRKEMEKTGVRFSPKGRKMKDGWDWHNILVFLFRTFLFVTCLFKRGRRNALDTRYVEIPLHFKKLPRQFDGFRILHLTDLHVDRLPDAVPHILDLIKGKEFDIAVLTGDYRDNFHVEPEQIEPSMRLLLSSIESTQGIFATLGNHDSADYGPALEQWGANLLANESIELSRGGESIWLTGTDDVNRFFTTEAPKAFSATPPGFKIALVHSAEMYSEANKYGYSLYLCGHTHGGQVCLPGGRPLFTHQDAPRSLSKGLWRHDKLVGYTSSGAGVVGVDARFNCHAEVTCFVLRSSSQK